MLDLNQIIILFVSIILIIFLFFYFTNPLLILVILKRVLNKSLFEYLLLFLSSFLGFLISFLFAFNQGYDARITSLVNENIPKTDGIIYQANLEIIRQEHIIEILQKSFVSQKNFFDQFIPLYMNYAKINNIDTILIKLDSLNLLTLTNDYNLYIDYKTLNFNEIIISKSLANTKKLNELDIVELDFYGLKFPVKIKKIVNDNGLLGFDFPVNEFSNNVVGSILVSDKFFKECVKLDESSVNLIFVTYRGFNIASEADQFELTKILKTLSINMVFFDIKRYYLSQLYNNSMFFGLPQFWVVLLLPLILLNLVLIAFFIKKYTAKNIFLIETQILKNYGLSNFILIMINTLRLVILLSFGPLFGYFFAILLGGLVKQFIINYFADFTLKPFLEIDLIFNFNTFLLSFGSNVIFVFLICLIIFFSHNSLFHNFCFSKFQILELHEKQKWYLFDFNSFLFIIIFLIFAFYLFQDSIFPDWDIKNFLFYFLFSILFLFITYKIYALRFITKDKFLLISFLFLLITSMLSFKIFDVTLKNNFLLFIIPSFLTFCSILILFFFFIKHIKVLNIIFVVAKVFYEKVFLNTFLIIFASIVFIFYLAFYSGFFLNDSNFDTLVSNFTNFKYSNLLIYNHTGDINVDTIKNFLSSENNGIGLYLDYIVPVKVHLDNLLNDYQNLGLIELDNFDAINCFSNKQDCINKFLDQKGVVLSYDLYTKIKTSLINKNENKNLDNFNDLNIRLTYLNNKSFDYPVIGYLSKNNEFKNLGLIMYPGFLSQFDNDVNPLKIVRIKFNTTSSIDQKEKIVEYLRLNYGKSINIVDNIKLIYDIRFFIKKVGAFIVVYLVIFYLLLSLVTLFNSIQTIFFSLNNFYTDLTLKRKMLVSFILVFLLIFLILISLIILIICNIYFAYYYSNYLINIHFSSDSSLFFLYNFIVINLFVVIAFLSLVFLKFSYEKKFK